MRNYRLEARLSSRETDNRAPADVDGYMVTIILPERDERDQVDEGGEA